MEFGDSIDNRVARPVLRTRPGHSIVPHAERGNEVYSVRSLGGGSGRRGVARQEFNVITAKAVP